MVRCGRETVAKGTVPTITNLSTLKDFKVSFTRTTTQTNLKGGGIQDLVAKRFCKQLYTHTYTHIKDNYT